MSKARILLVEDEMIVALDIAHGLRRLGYEVLGPVATGEEALALAEQTKPDLVLMDIQLRGSIDGIQAGRQLTQEYQVPLVFLTAYADASTLQRAKVAVPSGYLLKPFEDRELHGTIEVALHKHRAAQTELLHASEALQLSEERFKQLVESLKEHAVLMLDPRGHIQSWNTGAERITGYHASEVAGQHITKLFPLLEGVQQNPARALSVAVREGQSQEEGWRLRKDRSRFWADIVISPLRDPQGHLQGFAAVIRDITERKNTEEEIRRVNSSLEARVKERTTELNAVNRDLEAFTYSAAHDLRAPLRRLQSYFGAVREEYGAALPPEANDLMDRAANCVQRMNQLLEDLLRFSVVGKQQLNPRDVSLDALVHEVVTELRQETGGRQIDWRIHPLPTIRCDPSLIRDVLVNLLSNALKYTRPRQLAVIEVGSTVIDGKSCFFVKDNGVGFNMRHARKLFTPFERLHSGREFEGTGVGLAIVQRILIKHGGSIWAEAEEDRGAVFYFTIGDRRSPSDDVA